jgi:hypothetical protein
MFGLTNFWWAKLTVKIMFVFLALDYIINIVLFIDNKKDSIFFCVDTIFFVYCTIQSWKAIKVNERLHEKYIHGYSYINERIISWITFRIACFLWVLPILILMIIELIMLIVYGRYDGVFIVLPSIIALCFVIPCVYLMSCTPQPPSKSKIKSWLKKMREKLRESFLPTPEPVTVGI